MAKKPATQTPAAAPAPTFAMLVAATLAQNFLYVPSAVSQPWVAAGHAEVNASNVDAAGNIATRATQSGIAHSQGTEVNTQTAASGTASSKSAQFEIDDGIEPPEVKRGRAATSKYPFDKLNIGQSFHIPATEDEPNPAKAYASTVTSATARYATEHPTETKEYTVKEYQRDADGKRVKGADGEYVVTSTTTEKRPVLVLVRKFIIRAVGADDKKGAGARVFRVALDD